MSQPNFYFSVCSFFFFFWWGGWGGGGQRGKVISICISTLLINRSPISFKFKFKFPTFYSVFSLYICYSSIDFCQWTWHHYEPILHKLLTHNVFVLLLISVFTSNALLFIFVYTVDDFKITLGSIDFFPQLFRVATPVGIIDWGM